MMSSIVININVETISIEPKYRDCSYISFIDYLITKQYYINIVYKYYICDKKYFNNNKIEVFKILENNEMLDYFERFLADIHLSMNDLINIKKGNLYMVIFNYFANN